jgi:hypothetical protein
MSSAVQQSESEPVGQAVYLCNAYGKHPLLHDMRVLAFRMLMHCSGSDGRLFVSRLASGHEAISVQIDRFSAGGASVTGDFRSPPDNNRAERDVRMAKLSVNGLAAAHTVNRGCPLPPGQATTISRPDQLPELKAPTRLPMSGMTMIERRRSRCT